MPSYTLADPPRRMPGPGDWLPPEPNDTVSCLACGRPADQVTVLCDRHDDLADADRETLMGRIGQLEGENDSARERLWLATRKGVSA